MTSSQLAYFTSFYLAKGENINNIIWTEVAESQVLTEKELNVAYRDLVLESVIKHVFQVMKESSKLGQNKTHFPPKLMIKDPLPLSKKMSLKKKVTGLFDIEFKAWDLSVAGLHNALIKDLIILRHIGLTDIHVVFRLAADITVSGKYSLDGTGLGLLPVEGIIV